MSEFIGHGAVIKDLWRAVARDRVGHAYLFVGPEGSGRRTLAGLFARALLCESPGERPCGACRACVLAEAGTHPDLELLDPDGASIKIEQMRAVRGRVATKPLLGRRRVFLLAGMERLTEAAANSFLLTLEEPPPGAVFIGWALAGEPLVPTVLSRCQVIRLQPLAAADLAAALVARGVAPERAARLAAVSRGLPGQALRMLEEMEPGSSGDGSLAGLLRLDLPGLFAMTDDLSRLEREEVAKRLAAIEEELRAAIVAQTLGKAPSPPLADLSLPAAWRLAARLARAQEYLRANVNLRLLLDDLALALYWEQVHARRLYG
ncbi:MAG: DNA polymerase III subunit delta' [Patescibacteria group bacterium]